MHWKVTRIYAMFLHRFSTRIAYEMEIGSVEIQGRDGLPKLSTACPLDPYSGIVHAERIHRNISHMLHFSIARIFARS